MPPGGVAPFPVTTPSRGLFVLDGPEKLPVPLDLFSPEDRPLLFSPPASRPVVKTVSATLTSGASGPPPAPLLPVEPRTVRPRSRDRTPPRLSSRDSSPRSDRQRSRDRRSRDRYYRSRSRHRSPPRRRRYRSRTRSSERPRRLSRCSPAPPRPSRREGTPSAVGSSDSGALALQAARPPPQVSTSTPASSAASLGVAPLGPLSAPLALAGVLPTGPLLIGDVVPQAGVPLDSGSVSDPPLSQAGSLSPDRDPTLEPEPDLSSEASADFQQTLLWIQEILPEAKLGSVERQQVLTSGMVALEDTTPSSKNFLPWAQGASTALADAARSLLGKPGSSRAKAGKLPPAPAFSWSVYRPTDSKRLENRRVNPVFERLSDPEKLKAASTGKVAPVEFVNQVELTGDRLRAGQSSLDWQLGALTTLLRKLLPQDSTDPSVARALRLLLSANRTVAALHSQAAHLVGLVLAQRREGALLALPASFPESDREALRGSAIPDEWWFDPTVLASAQKNSSQTYQRDLAGALRKIAERPAAPRTQKGGANQSGGSKGKAPHSPFKAPASSSRKAASGRFSRGASAKTPKGRGRGAGGKKQA